MNGNNDDFDEKRQRQMNLATHALSEAQNGTSLGIQKLILKVDKITAAAAALKEGDARHNLGKQNNDNTESS